MKHLKKFEEQTFDDQIEITDLKQGDYVIDDYVHTYTESTLFIIKDITIPIIPFMNREKTLEKNKRYKLHYGDPDLKDIFHKWVFVEEIYLAEPYEVEEMKYNL